jgi:uncharacterized protein YdaU (DUF1376 family)
MKDKKDKIYYFQEKSNDILDLQDELTTEEIGIYFILKAGYFKYSGQLTKENIYQRCKFFGDKIKMDSMISKLFDLQDGLLVNSNWLSEINSIKQLSEKRKQIAEKRWNDEGLKQKVANASKSKQKVANLADSDSKNKSDSDSDSKSKNNPDNDKIIIKGKEIDLPEFINKDLFIAFVEMRIKIKKPLTEVATGLLIKKLIEFEKKQAGFANQALENSIEGSYQGIFEPRQNNYNNNQGETKRFMTAQEIKEYNNKKMIADFIARNKGGNNNE